MVQSLRVAVRVRAEAEGGGAREACHRGSRGYYMHGCRTRLCVRARCCTENTGAAAAALRCAALEGPVNGAEPRCALTRVDNRKAEGD